MKTDNGGTARSQLMVEPLLVLLASSRSGSREISTMGALLTAAVVGMNSLGVRPGRLLTPILVDPHCGGTAAMGRKPNARGVRHAAAPQDSQAINASVRVMGTRSGRGVWRSAVTVGWLVSATASLASASHRIRLIAPATLMAAAVAVVDRRASMERVTACLVCSHRTVCKGVRLARSVKSAISCATQRAAKQSATLRTASVWLVQLELQGEVHQVQSAGSNAPISSSGKVAFNRAAIA
jgi:hypothetical protein